MKTKTINLYSLNELNDKAKEKAIEKLRYSNVEDNWYDFTIENFKDENNLFKVEKVYFSGFYSQGDGAMFEYSAIENETLQKAINNITDLSKKDKTILFDNLEISSAKGAHSGWYSHSYSCNHSIYFNINVSNKKALELFYKYESIIENEIVKEYVSICDQLYKELKEEYEQLTSDESVIEFILENDIFFTEDGERE